MGSKKMLVMVRLAVLTGVIAGTILMVAPVIFRATSRLSRIFWELAIENSVLPHEFIPPALIFGFMIIPMAAITGTIGLAMSPMPTVATDQAGSGPEGGAPEKPAPGAACNGCGACCKAIPCVLARDLIAAVEGPCPALEWEDGRYWCGLLRAAHRHVPGLRQKPWADKPIRDMIMRTGAFGAGCDSG